MADEGFKRKLTTILSANISCYSRLMPGTAEPMPHKLTPLATDKTDIVQQYWFSEFFWTNGCDDRQYLINSSLKSITKKGEKSWKNKSSIMRLCLR